MLHIASESSLVDTAAADAARRMRRRGASELCRLGASVARPSGAAAGGAPAALRVAVACSTSAASASATLACEREAEAAAPQFETAPKYFRQPPASPAAAAAAEAAPPARPAARSSRAASSSASAAARNRLPPLTDELKSLLRVPCVGIKNAQHLTDKGIRSASDLRTVLQRSGGDCARMAEYLVKDVGLRSRLHATTIAQHVAQSVREEGEAAPPAAAEAQRLTICVEGNISAGKSTFLDSIQGSSSCGRAVRVVPEPVDKWTNIPGVGELAGAPGLGEHNILAKFYEDPRRWGYTFQNWVFFTRFMQERESASGAAWPAAAARPRGLPDADCRLMERSIFSDRLVFVEALSGDGSLNEMEMAIYRSWFEFMLSDRPSLVPDAFIYLRAQPETCHARMRVRARGEEAAVPLDYLHLLHSKHEGWFGLPGNNELRRTDGSHVVGSPYRADAVGLASELLNSYPDAGVDLDGQKWRVLGAELVAQLLPARLRGKVAFLRTAAAAPAAAAAAASSALLPADAPPAAGDALHDRIIRRVPALVLDCNGHMQPNDARREEYASDVADFYSFVSQLKKIVYPLVGGPGAGAREKWGQYGADDMARLERSLMEELLKAKDRSLGGVVLPSAAQRRAYGKKMVAGRAL